MDSDVVIVGGGPTGLLLASELRLAGVRVLVLDRNDGPGTVQKANGLGGQILELLRYRGLLRRLEEEASTAAPGLRFPFGGIHLDLSNLDDPPLRGISLPQTRLEVLLDQHARELGSEIRRDHDVVALRQDHSGVTVEVRGPDGLQQVSGRYVVGCDGPYSKVREDAEIAFPGTTYPETIWLGSVVLADSVRRGDDGTFEVHGVGVVSPGFTRTERGVFACGRISNGDLLIQVTEYGPADLGEHQSTTLAEFEESIRRVLGGDLPLKTASRLSRFGFQARQAESYRKGRIFVAGDAAHEFPATGIGLNVGMLDGVNLAWKLGADIQGWAPSGLLDTYNDERHFAGERAMFQTEAQVGLRRGEDAAASALRELFSELLQDEPASRRLGALIAGTDIRYPVPNASDHPLNGTLAPDITLKTDSGKTSVAKLMRRARPLFVDFSGRSDLCDRVRKWGSRIEIRTAEAELNPAEALLIRPDAVVAWAAPGANPLESLEEALSHWFGDPEDWS